MTLHSRDRFCMPSRNYPHDHGSGSLLIDYAQGQPILTSCCARHHHTFVAMMVWNNHTCLVTPPVKFQQTPIEPDEAIAILK